MLTTLFSRLVLTFGDRPIPPRTVVEEIVMGFLLVVPFGIFLGQLTIRLCCHPPKFLRADVWNTVLRLLVADVTMEILLPSVQCLALEDGPGYSLQLLRQSWGFACPAPESTSPKDALSPTATGVVFALRLLFMCVGVHLGESFVPIALTGGIACGKSTVARLLKYGGRDNDDDVYDDDHLSKQENNNISDGSVYLVDTDTIAHEILLPNTPDSVYHKVVATFGTEILQDSSSNITDSPPEIDRRKLGDAIFKDPSQRRLLNRITHPRIIYIMLKRMLWGLFLSNKDLTIADVPLLFESGKLRWMFCLTLLVGCENETQLERLTARNPDLSRAQCSERIQSQMDVHEKCKMADLVIWNDSTFDELEIKVEEMRQELMNRIYGVGLSLLQLLIIIGGSVPLAVLSKLYTLRNSNQ